ncbi:hypothetical protein E2562_025125, partial [Oryza meyeriana var. granulata]
MNAGRRRWGCNVGRVLQPLRNLTTGDAWAASSRGRRLLNFPFLVQKIVHL